MRRVGRGSVLLNGRSMVSVVNSMMSLRIDEVGNFDQCSSTFPGQ